MHYEMDHVLSSVVYKRPCIWGAFWGDEDWLLKLIKLIKQPSSDPQEVSFNTFSRRRGRKRKIPKWGEDSFSLKKQQSRRILLFSLGYWGYRAWLFGVSSGRGRGNRHVFQQKKFLLSMKKKWIATRVVKPLTRLPWKHECLSLGMFRTQLGRTWTGCWAGY